MLAQPMPLPLHTRQEPAPPTSACLRAVRVLKEPVWICHLYTMQVFHNTVVAAHLCTSMHSLVLP